MRAPSFVPAGLTGLFLALFLACSGGGTSPGSPGGGGGGGTTPSFSLSLGSPSLAGQVPASGTATLTTSVLVVPAGGFAGTVTFTLQGTPSGVTYAFTPAASASATALQLTLSSVAPAGTATLTVKGSSPGVADATATLTLSLTGGGSASKLPIVATVEAQCRQIAAQTANPLDQVRAINSFMKGRSEYVGTGVDEASLSAWGELPNGRLHLVTTAYAPKRKPTSAGLQALAEPPVGSAAPTAECPAPQLAPLVAPVVAAAAGNALPGASYARLLHSFGPNFEGQDPITDVGGWLTKAGWTLRAGAEGDASLAVLKAVSGDGFFYINTHGGYAEKSSTGTRFFCLSSSTIQSSTLDDTPEYKDDWDNYRIVYLTGRNGGTILGGLVDDWDTYYGITYAFVTKYWSFAANSVVWINACFSQGGTPSTNAFRFACQQKGAGVYLGWTAALNNAVAYPSIRYFVDRCVGANQYQKESPAQRPFPWDAVLTNMRSKSGLTTGPNGEVLQETPQTPGTPPALLAPSIRLLEVDEFSGEMKLKGAFGSDQGEVTVDGNTVAVKNWGQEEITCTLPKEASGDVLVKVRGLKSNPRPLTEWSLPLKYTWDMTGGIIKFTTGTANIRYRMDVSGFRKKPGETPTYLRRGTWPVLSSSIAVTGTGSVSPCSLTGGTITLPTLPSDRSPTAFLQAPLIVDGNTQTGLLGLAFGVAANSGPWWMVCPGAPSAPVAPAFGLLQVQTSFYQTQAEDAAASVGPFPAMIVTYGTSLELKDGSYSDSRAGAMKVEWQNATQKSPPRPGDAGI